MRIINTSYHSNKANTLFFLLKIQVELSHTVACKKSVCVIMTRNYKEEQYLCLPVTFMVNVNTTFRTEPFKGSSKLLRFSNVFARKEILNF